MLIKWVLTEKFYKNIFLGEDDSGLCLLYNKWDFAVFMCTLMVICKILSLGFFGASSVASKMSNIPDVTTEKKSELKSMMRKSMYRQSTIFG